MARKKGRGPSIHIRELVKMSGKNQDQQGGVLPTEHGKNVEGAMAKKGENSKGGQDVKRSKGSEMTGDMQVARRLPDSGQAGLWLHGVSDKKNGQGKIVELLSNVLTQTRGVDSTSLMVVRSGDGMR